MKYIKIYEAYFKYRIGDYVSTVDYKHENVICIIKKRHYSYTLKSNGYFLENLETTEEFWREEKEIRYLDDEELKKLFILIDIKKYNL